MIIVYIYIIYILYTFPLTLSPFLLTSHPSTYSLDSLNMNLFYLPSFQLFLFLSLLTSLNSVHAVMYLLPLSSFHLPVLPFTGGQGAGPGSDTTVPAPHSLIGGDISPIPLLTSPDLDALCDPEAPPLSASLPRRSPPRSTSRSNSLLGPSPFSFTSSQPPVAPPTTAALSPAAPPPVSSAQPGTQPIDVH